jgi:hypothetical protein
MMEHALCELRPLLASSLIHLAWPSARQIAYLKEIGFHVYAEEKIPTDELIWEFHHGMSSIRGGVVSGVLSSQDYEGLRELEKALIAMEDALEFCISRELDTKPWQDIRSQASQLVKQLDITPAKAGAS